MEAGIILFVRLVLARTNLRFSDPISKYGPADYERRPREYSTAIGQHVQRTCRTYLSCSSSGHPYGRANGMDKSAIDVGDYVVVCTIGSNRKSSHHI